MSRGMHGLTLDNTLILIRTFESDVFEASCVLAPIRATSEILDDAAGLAEVYGLRAFIAVQLATARVARSLDSECRSMAAFDIEFRRASAREGIQLISAKSF